MTAIRCYVGTSSECATVAALCDKLFGYPKNGVVVGGGIHASPEAGRTLRYSETRSHPTLPATFALPIDDTVAFRLTQDSTLSAGEKSALNVARTAAQLVTFADREA